MLIIPLDRAFDWRHPPVITLILLFANLLVFLFVQWNDERETQHAAETYINTGLAQIEVPRYRRYIKFHHADTLAKDLEEAPDDWPGWMWAIQTDNDFQTRLKSGRVISRASPEYTDWQQKRREFELSYEQITYVHYGLRTAQPTWETAFTHMFLHAGVWHLLGNALFLLAVGFLVEATLSRTLYLISYLLAGLGSAAFNLLFDPPSLIPGIGASGAISGLMGMYTVLYGMRRIRFFYAIGIYFDYIKLPAIVLLPAWIANELFQIWLYPDSNINYMAHLGGLVSGAALGLIAKHFTTAYNMSQIEEADAQEQFGQQLKACRALCDNFEYRKALPQLRRLYTEQPDNPTLLHLYHEAARIEPDSDAYHEASNSLLQLPRTDAAGAAEQVAVYREYIERARPSARFKANTLFAILPKLLQLDATTEAERVVNVLCNRATDDARLPPLLLALAKVLADAGETTKAAHYQHLAKHQQAAKP